MMNKKSREMLIELHKGRKIIGGKQYTYYWEDTGKRVDANAVAYLLANGYASKNIGCPVVISEYSKAVWNDMLNYELKGMKVTNG
jgi:hypothetical protein